MKGFTYKVLLGDKIQGYWDSKTGKLVHNGGESWVRWAVQEHHLVHYILKPINFNLENK